MDQNRISKLYQTLIQKKTQCFNYAKEEFDTVNSLDMSDLRQESLEQARSLLQDGKVAILIMAGGQGSRLHHDGPKGTFRIDLGEFGRKSIFELHMEVLHCVFLKYGVYLPVYLMTGESNHDQTLRFFEEHGYFGYPVHKVKFLKQNMMPCVDLEGNLLLDAHGEAITAPDGNAGFSELLKQSEEMQALLDQGVKYLYVHNVDNILTQFADEYFLAALIQRNAQVGVKVAPKSTVEEKVGVLLKYQGEATIIEYSELPREILEAKKDDGSILYSDGSIGSYIFDLRFLNELKEVDTIYHLAKKKIPYYRDGVLIDPQTENGYKFEAYIFDLFQYAKEIVSYRIEKELEFAPVKNAQGADSPETAAVLYYKKVNHLNALAFQALTEENFDLARQSYTDLYHLYKKPQSLYYLAIVAFNQGAYTAAYHNAQNAFAKGLEGELKEALLKDMPKICDFMHLEKAKKAIGFHQYFEALEELESIGDTLDDSFEYHYNMAYCRRRAGQRNNVSYHLKRAHVLNPAHADLYAEIAANMIYEGDLEAAKKTLAQGLKLDPDSYLLTAVMADYYEVMNKGEDRDACLKKLEELERKCSENAFDLQDDLC